MQVITMFHLQWSLCLLGLHTSWEISTSALMSQICMRGLVGDSSMTNRVSPGRIAFLKALHQRSAPDQIVSNC
jgi:hypothetical protein